MSRLEERVVEVAGPFDLRQTLSFLDVGFGDPTFFASDTSVCFAAHTPDGPAAIEMRQAGQRVRGVGEGPGASWLLAGLPELLGCRDDPDTWPSAEILGPFAKRAGGTRFARSRRVVECLVAAVLQQKVNGKEASRAYRNLTRRFSEPAPGPWSLWLPPHPEVLRSLPASELPPLGVPERNGRCLREIGFRAKRLESFAELDPLEAQRRLCLLPGVGVWTAASVAHRCLGDPDAVPVGDYHLCHLVAYNLAGEERADDERMLELLEPFKGQRGRVVRWLMIAGRGAPRRGPRMPLRPLPQMQRP